MNRKLRLEIAAILGSIAFMGWISRRKIGAPHGRTSLTSRRVFAALGLGALALALAPSRKYSFRGRSVVITGGSRGLGLEIARQLLKEGAKVTLLARDPGELERAKLILKKISKDVFTCVCDVTDSEHLDTAFAEARARFGAIDILINNAGVITVGPWTTLTDSDFRAQFKIHVDAPIQATRLIRPYFHMQGEGRIINISSIGGKIPVPHMAAYSASKFALGGFSEAVRPELKAENIIVTTAYPGLMRTGSPVQAVFKGDQEKEFAWFATSDNAPFLSMSAKTAARRILNASREGRAEIVVSVPAKIGTLAHNIFPEIYSFLVELTNRILPAGDSKERRTGAASFGFLGKRAWTNPLRWIVNRAAHDHNQEMKYDAELNLGLKNKYGAPTEPSMGS